MGLTRDSGWLVRSVCPAMFASATITFSRITCKDGQVNKL